MAAMPSALNNLLSPPVLFFALGAFAGLVRSDLSFPKWFTRVLGIYLMAAIGLKGGAALSQNGVDGTAAVTLAAGLAMGVIIPLLVFLLARRLSFSRPDASSLAAHYGSVSLVTFGAAAVFLSDSGVQSSGYMAAVLAAMEAPAIVVGVALARQGGSAKRVLREALTSSSVLVLLGSTFIGVLLSAQGVSEMKEFFVTPFTGVLCLFLLAMATNTFSDLSALRRLGFLKLCLGVVIPLLSAVLAVLVCLPLGLGVGDTTLLVTLAASGSYIAAPAAMRLAVPEANPALTLPMVVGVTFPFNLLVGIPLYFELARLVS